MPSPDDEEGDKFWKKVNDRLKNDQGANAMIIHSFVRFDIMKKCMKTSLINKHIIDCGKELNRNGEFTAAAIKQNSSIISNG